MTIYTQNAPLGARRVSLLPSSIDYRPLAKQIVGFQIDKYQQAKAIFLWLCKNISYDTSYRIHSADECIRTKRGVCQAYCELFVHLGKAVGLRVDMISGDAKNSASNCTERHSWVFVYTNDTQGFLVDPTWGAGSVDSSKRFIPNPTPYIWFAVNPKWMIFSHFPDDEKWQLMATKISKQQFLSIPPLDAELEQYGLDGTSILAKTLKREPLPEIFPTFSTKVSLIDIPLSPTLEIGKEYRFTICPKTNAIWGVMNGSHRNRVWTKLSNGNITMSFTPRQNDDLFLCFNDNGTNQYAIVVRYKIVSNGTKPLPLSPLNEVKQQVAELTQQFHIPNQDTVKKEITEKIINPIKKIFK